ncbi:hypothetical protein GCM10008956_36660 [Deinococcus arenae]|uniref:Uncharacterized protein n=1 Tax=Deinococcus arenae TaxID=1452751 RepID=A0A8H9LAC4_9DEIO|nr:hypothetical protein [Deinococcus arenae]AWT34860.1 hypothetical protein DM785_04250 [Deinococcus actinosclerus]GGM57668.1 hypothetical protein GCM10008956_36660 [Deinococcus arenae]
MVVVTQLSESRVPVGVTGAGEWVYLAREGGWLSLTDSAPIFVVTVVQQGAAFDANLRRRLVAVGLTPSLAATFPVDSSIRLGLTWPTDFWQQAALDWLEQKGGVEAFLPELAALVHTGGTQRIRHTARRLMRAVRRQARD